MASTRKELHSSEQSGEHKLDLGNVSEMLRDVTEMFHFCYETFQGLPLEVL